MTKLQYIVIASAISLFLVLYFGCETKPHGQEALEKTRALAAQSTDINTLLVEAKGELAAKEAANVLAMEQDLAATTSDSSRITILKQLSSNWYRLKHPAIAGYYAEEIAEISGTEEAWSIAGSTYSIGIQRTPAGKIRDFCTEKAIQAFENASSLNPTKVAYKTNLALVYTDNPPQENPMKGILMLIDLNKKYPENVSVMMNLGRLGIKTGQYDKAIVRLDEVLRLEPSNSDAPCLLAQAYKGLGNTAKMQEYDNKCSEALNR
jgi:tetratricopeptide (TPR) repeat protein